MITYELKTAPIILKYSEILCIKKKGILEIRICEIKCTRSSVTPHVLNAWMLNITHSDNIVLL